MILQTGFAIISNQQLAPKIWRLSFSARQLTNEAVPGQFLMIRIAELTDPLLRRPLGIHNLDQETGAVDILYQVVGRGTRQLTRKSPGEILDVLGPLGNGFTENEWANKHVLVAGGIGIAPFPPLARQLREKFPKASIDLLFGAASKDDLAGHDVMIPYCDNYIITTEDGSEGRKGLVTGPLVTLLSGCEPNKTALYACGPMPMLAAVAKLAASHEVYCEVSLEAQMACGMGTCMGCVTKTTPVLKATDPKQDTEPCKSCNEDAAGGYQRVCSDGPVFDARSIDWSE